MPSRFFYSTQDVVVNGQLRKSFTANRIMTSDLPDLMNLSETGIIRFMDTPTVPVKHQNATEQIAPVVHPKNRKTRKTAEAVQHDQEEEVLP